MVLIVTFFGVLFLIALFNNKKILAATNYESVNSPIASYQGECFLNSLDNESVKEIIASYNVFGTQILQLEFDYYVDTQTSEKKYKLPDIKDSEIFFASFYDARKELIGNSYLTKLQDSYICSYQYPYYCDMAEVRIYKQNKNEPAFVQRDKNFIGRMNCLMAHDADYYRNDAQSINLYDKDNVVIDPEAAESEIKDTLAISRITPSYYSMRLDYKNNIPIENKYNLIGKISLPVGKENLMTDEEKIVKFNSFKISPYNVEKEGNQVAEDSIYGDFYLPEGVDEFNIKIYDKEIGGDLKYQVHVSLYKK